MYYSDPDIRFVTYSFTGHEHLDDFDLINMNGRMYDPLLAMFLSPDNFIQSPGNTQNLNRYAYCLNNPLIYTDPDGEFFIVDDWLIGFVKGFARSIGGKHEDGHHTWFGDAWGSANRHAGNSAKIWGGLFASDPNKSFGGRVWETISRFTWQAPQTELGFFSAHMTNTFGQVNEVDYYGGATVLQRGKDAGAITLGSYIIGGRDIQADPRNELFQHEYGHYLQSQSSGLYYLSKYGIPSLLSKGDYFDHGNHPTEQDANVRALKYFMENEDGFTLADWNFNRASGGHPIIGFDLTLPYNDPINQAALRNGRTRLEWFDYLLGPNIIVSGLINALVLNSRY